MANRASNRVDLTRSPLKYPGAPVESTSLLLPECVHRLVPRPGRRLGQARVERCDDCAARDGLRVVPLNYELLRWNAAGVDARYAVAAVGSNASTDVLRTKMERAGVEPIIPLIRARLANVVVACSAHVAGPGFIPAAPVRSTGDGCDVVVGLLDRDQLRHLDTTEPNYVRRFLSSGEYHLDLDGGERLTGFHIYDSEWGLLADGGRPLRLTRQATAAAWLADRGLAPWVDHDPAGAAAVLAGDRALRDALRGAFAERGLVVPAGLTGEEFTDTRYASTISAWPRQPATSMTGLRCTSTSDDLRRDGQQCVQVHPDDARRLGLDGHAQVTRAIRPDEPGFIARVVVDGGQTPGTVGADQIIRNGLGLERGEYVGLTPARVPATPVADLVIARPHYVACRVQAADLAIVEREAALLSPLTMSLLGIQPGSRVVLEGVPARPGGQVPVVRVKAHEAPQEIVDRRMQVSGGGHEARFPSSRDALAVFPDLPWIFLDAATRTRLGLGGHRLRVVRVRAARADQSLTELRDLMLLFILAAVGVATVIPSAKLVFAFLVVLVLGTAVLARARLRSRLGT
jgi:hypothetical protein